MTDNAKPAFAGTSESPCSTFPNPLCVRFGEGRILMLTFKDADGGGVVLRDSGDTHAVGEDANMPPEKGVMPKVGEVYLHFTNIESAQALRLTLDEAIADMENPQLICNKEFVYENFCSLPKGHEGPCDNPPNAHADLSADSADKVRRVVGNSGLEDA